MLGDWWASVQTLLFWTCQSLPLDKALPSVSYLSWVERGLDPLWKVCVSVKIILWKEHSLHDAGDEAEAPLHRCGEKTSLTVFVQVFPERVD